MTSPKPPLSDAVRGAIAQAREPWVPMVLGGLVLAITPSWSGHPLPAAVRLARLGQEAERALYRATLDPFPRRVRLEAFLSLMGETEGWLGRGYMPWDVMADEGLDTVDALLLLASLAVAVEGRADLAVAEALEMVPEGVEPPEETLRRFGPDAPLHDTCWLKVHLGDDEEVMDRGAWLDIMTRLRMRVRPTPEAGGMLGPLRDYPSPRTS